MCILRGTVFCASFEMPCYVHPSRCCVLCILRDVLLCASFEVLCFVHPSRRRSLGFCFFGKNVSPLPNELLPGGSLCSKVSSLLWNFDRLFVYHRGNTRKFQILRKRVDAPTRGSGSELVNAACFLVPDGNARGNHSNARFYLGSGRGAVRPAKGVCEGTVLSCTRSARSRGYKRGERGREAPKSLLGVELA